MVGGTRFTAGFMKRALVESERKRRVPSGEERKNEPHGSQILGVP
jgi:hypothetical protein